MFRDNITSPLNNRRQFGSICLFEPQSRQIECQLT